MDFHLSCATDLFGCATAPLYPFEAPNSELFNADCVAENSVCALLEALSMRMAQSALILTVPNSLVRNREGGLIHVKKYDPQAETIGELIARLDGCEFDDSFEMVAELVEDFSSISRLDLVTLFEHLIFGWIVGCNTMGVDSFALSRPNAGVCSLTPIFRVVPAFEGDELALTLSGKRDNIRRSDFESAMRYMGLKDRIIRITIEKMIKAKEQWLNQIESSVLSDDDKRRFSELVCSRLQRLNK